MAQPDPVATGGISAGHARHLVYGRSQVDLADAEQLVEAAQLRALGRPIGHARQRMDGRATLREISEQRVVELERQGLDLLDSRHAGNLASFRGLDLAAVLNRAHNLKAVQAP